MVLIARYGLRVFEQPTEDDQVVFRNLESSFESLNAESFNIYFSTHFGFNAEPNPNLIFLIPNMPSLYSCKSITCEQFFQEGQAFLRRNMSHHLLPSHTLEEKIIPSIMAKAQILYDTSHHSYVGDHSSATYSLAIDVIIEYVGESGQDQLTVLESVREYLIEEIGENINDDEEEEEDLEERIMRESMEEYELRMIPASQEAIESLNTMKVKDNVMKITADVDRCCICLEEYDKENEVLVMPCCHAYHIDCIVDWLKISHFCPLCRFQMPVAYGDDS